MQRYEQIPRISKLSDEKIMGRSELFIHFGPEMAEMQTDEGHTKKPHSALIVNCQVVLPMRVHSVYKCGFFNYSFSRGLNLRVGSMYRLRIRYSEGANVALSG